MSQSKFVVVHLTESEATFVRDSMRLICMNESGDSADMASQIERVIARNLNPRPQASRLFHNMFADLYPEGRE
jgi:hypothetical protein